MLNDLLFFFGSNEIVLGIVSVTGIIGFILTIFVSMRTAKISKILKYNEVTSRYNSERLAFKKAFGGHKESILQDGIKTEKLLKDILENVEEYHAKFDEIFTMREKYILWRLTRLLKRRVEKVDFNKLCNYLAIISGRLSKEGDLKYG